jgi:hypothetical protein
MTFNNSGDIITQTPILTGTPSGPLALPAYTRCTVIDSLQVGPTVPYYGEWRGKDHCKHSRHMKEGLMYFEAIRHESVIILPRLYPCSIMSMGSQLACNERTC